MLTKTTAPPWLKNKLVESLKYHEAYELRRAVEAASASTSLKLVLKFKRYSSIQDIEATVTNVFNDAVELAFLELPELPSAWPGGEPTVQKLTITFPSGKIGERNVYIPYSTVERVTLAAERLVESATLKLDDWSSWKYDDCPENALELLVDNLEGYRDKLASELEAKVSKAYEPLVKAFEESSGIDFDELAWQAEAYEPQHACVFFKYKGFANIPPLEMWPKNKAYTPAVWLAKGWTLRAQVTAEASPWSYEIDYVGKRFIEHDLPVID